jgi:two-component system CheB/CheR fusion protein
MNRAHKRTGYLIAVFGVLGVLAARITVHSFLDEQALLLPFMLAVVAAAWRGGLGPGLVATALGTVAGTFFVAPTGYSISVDPLAYVLNDLIFVGVGVTVSGLCEALHAAQRRETEKQFRTLADSIAQLVWMARPDGYRFWYNRRWYEFTGAAPAQVEGWNWQAFHDPGELPATLEKWRAALQTGEPFEDTFRLRRHDGTMRWHLARARPLRDDRGETVCWFGTNTDITERLEAEQFLIDADRRKDEFLAMLAHELRNPLAPISNAVQLWPLVRENKAEVDHLCAVIDRQVKQIVRLVDDLTDVSRITHGKIVLRRQAIDARELVARAVEENQPLVDRCGHHLFVKDPPEPVLVDGDAARLTQVFANLLNNAAKYTPPGGTIRVTTAVDGHQAVVSVCDDGCGIPRPMLSRIFELFEQIDNTPQRAHGGLGIGLTLVKQLVELHGGTVEARSNGPGRGSEFVVRLPLAATSEGATPNCSGAEENIGHHMPRRVLVIDDYASSGDTLAMVLKSLGNQAMALTDPIQALEYLAAHKPDLVIVDVAMPGMSGYEVAQRIRQNPQLNDVFLVALTGHGRPADRQAALDAGFDRHITKPVAIQVLANLLAEVGTRHNKLAPTS